MKHILFDKDGQPLSNRLNRDNNLRKSVDLLAGISMCALADGVVSDEEALLFAQQVESVAKIEAGWPMDYMLARVKGIFADGIVDDDERAELKEMMEALVGVSSDDGVSVDASTALPLCAPAPVVIFASKKFLVTGKFAYGARKKVQKEIEDRGGIVSKSKGATTTTDYLVIGAMVSRDWKHQNMGNKIMRAVELREKGHPIHIIGEDHWMGHL